MWRVSVYLPVLLALCNILLVDELIKLSYYCVYLTVECEGLTERCLLTQIRITNRQYVSVADIRWYYGLLKEGEMLEGSFGVAQGIQIAIL